MAIALIALFVSLLTGALLRLSDTFEGYTSLKQPGDDVPGGVEAHRLVVADRRPDVTSAASARARPEPQAPGPATGPPAEDVLPGALLGGW